MKIDLTRFEALSDYENIMVVDNKGEIIFYDVSDLNVLQELEIRPEEILGKKATSVYDNIKDKESIFMKVLKTKKPICKFNQEMITKSGNKVTAIGSTYPIMENEKVIGAVEFSKHFYNREDTSLLNNFSNNKLYRKNNTKYILNDLITQDSKMLEIKDKLLRISQNNSTVFICGRTGTGKEIVSQSIHNLSKNYEGPFISQNCAAIPSTLIESILFGTVKGSFTGAENMPGLFELAQEGTLFLDEINSLDISLQVKLLKAVEDKVIRRIGDNKNIYLNMRIIAATNEDPEKLISERKLREDLYYRLSVVQVNLPELSERKEDINILINHFIDYYNKNMNIRIDSINQDALELLTKYNWPGNVRELRNVIESIFNNAKSKEITIDDIPERIINYIGEINEVDLQKNDDSLKNKIDSYEKFLIKKELDKSPDNFAEAARKLGISKQSLRYKIQKYDLR